MQSNLICVFCRIHVEITTHLLQNYLVTREIWPRFLSTDVNIRSDGMSRVTITRLWIFNQVSFAKLDKNVIDV